MVNLAMHPETVWTISRHLLRQMPLLSCTNIYVLCSYLPHMYPLQAAIIIDPSSGASIGIPTNLFQLPWSRNISKHFIVEIKFCGIKFHMELD